MMIREKLNKNPKIAASIAIVMVIICVSVAWATTRKPKIAAGLNYFTTNDSSPDAALAALFKDDSRKIPPFDHDGKPAFRAYVFTSDGGTTKWIAYLQRLTTKGKQEMDDIDAGKLGSDPVKIQQAKTGILMSETEIKKPGDANWVKAIDGSPDADRVEKLTPPDGQDLANVKSVFP